MEQRRIKIIQNKDGHGSTNYKISLPKKWIDKIFEAENNTEKHVVLEFDGDNAIILKKE